MNKDIPGLKNILKHRSFKLTAILVPIFFVAGIILFVSDIWFLALLIWLLAPIILSIVIKAISRIVSVIGILTVIFAFLIRNMLAIEIHPMAGNFLGIIALFISLFFAVVIFFNLLETYYKIKSPNGKDIDDTYLKN